MATSVIKTSTPQKLFADFPPAAAKGIPGMVTPNITADIQQPTDWSAINAALAASRRGSGGGTFRPGRKAPQRPSIEDEKFKLRAAFNEIYAPQIRSQSHDRAFMEPSQRGEQLRRQYGHVGQYPGGYWMSSGNVKGSPQGNIESNVPYQGRGENYTRAVLDQMWRMKTDPYLRAAQSMGGIGV